MRKFFSFVCAVFALVIFVAACGDEKDEVKPPIKIDAPAGCIWQVDKDDNYDCIVPATTDAGIADANAVQPDAGQQPAPDAGNVTPPEPTKIRVSWQVGKVCSFTLPGCYGTTKEGLPIVCEEPAEWSTLRQQATPADTYSDEFEVKDSHDALFFNPLAGCVDGSQFNAAMLDNKRQPVVHPGLEILLGNNSRGWVKVSPTAILDAAGRPNLKVRLR